MQFASSSGLLLLMILGLSACQHTTCGPGTIAVRVDNRDGRIDQDGRGYYVDADSGLRIRKLTCIAVSPPTACGVGTVVTYNPPYVIDPDGRGYYADSDGRGVYVDSDGRSYYADSDGRLRYVDSDGRGYYVNSDDTVPAQRACVLGEWHQEYEAN